jgi:cytochrome d ubiquinol oxidase subunit II
MIFDYETLKVIWWVFVGVLIIGFALTDGFDFGVGMMLPFLGKTDDERRVLIHVIGPAREDSQTWLITAGGATFAAWPLVYATAFSSFYIALMLLLFSLFLRPVGFDFRNRVGDPRRRNAWDWGLFIGDIVPLLICGIAFGNLLLGAPFHYDKTMQAEYRSSALSLLNPFALLTGLLNVGMLLAHGATFLQVKTDGTIRQRARSVSMVAALVSLVLFILGGIGIALAMGGAQITSMPLDKTVLVAISAWKHNHLQWPLARLIPLLAIMALIMTILASAWRKARLAFVSSGLAVTCIILTAATSLFPFIMPAPSVPRSSLTIWDSVSSEKTLGLMFWMAVIFLPLILLYIAWIYRVVRGKVTLQQRVGNKHAAH